MKTIDEIQNFFKQIHHFEQECITIARCKDPKFLDEKKWLFEEITYNHERMEAYVQFQENGYDLEFNGVLIKIEDFLVDLETIAQQWFNKQEQIRLKKEKETLQMFQKQANEKEKQDRKTYKRLKQKYGHTT